MQTRLLLVPSPLVGCGTWGPIANDLAGDGYAVSVPDLAGTVTAGPPYHLRQAQRQLSHHLALLTEPGQVAREIRQMIDQP